MNDNLGIEEIHQALLNKLLNYIKAEYLGKNINLLEACEKKLTKKGVLYQDFMVEANCGYEQAKDAIYDIFNDKKLKHILESLVDANIGFFKYPYLHQIESLKAYFACKDLLISTGTGSGKTECFLWPIVLKMILEAINNSKSWNTRGTRVVILYPMNALVSDQEARLRKMIGCEEFKNVFSDLTDSSRRPQFGMYTGRTKYSGSHTKDKDKKLANILESAYINTNGSFKKEVIINELKERGKYPAKKSLSNFIENLRNGNHYTDPDDAEQPGGWH